jgi:hypothetical protein
MSDINTLTEQDVEKIRETFKVGACCLQQALREIGLSWTQIASVTGCHKRNVSLHVVAAERGGKVTGWYRRSASQQSAALQVAAWIVAKKNIVPRGVTK